MRIYTPPLPARADLARGFAGVGDVEPDGVGGHEGAIEAVSPFDEEHKAGVEKIIPAEGESLLRRGHAVEVEMGGGKAAIPVLMDEGEGGAGGRGGGAEACENALHKAGLARAEVADQA